MFDNRFRGRLCVVIRNDRNFLLPGLARAQIHGLRALWLPSRIARFLLLALRNFHLAAIFQRAPGTELVQFFTPTQLRDGLLGIPAALFTTFAIALRELAVHAFVAFGFDRFHAALDTVRLERVVPSSVNVRGGNH